MKTAADILRARARAAIEQLQWATRQTAWQISCSLIRPGQLVRLNPRLLESGQFSQRTQPTNPSDAHHHNYKHPPPG